MKSLMATYKIKLSSDKVYIVDTDARVMWAEEFPDDKVTLADTLDPTHESFCATLLEGEDGAPADSSN